MDQTATCPNCSLTLSVPPQALGRSLRCPGCQVVFAAPAPPPAAPAHPYPPHYPYPYPPHAAAPPPPPAPPPPAPFAFDAKPGADADDDRPTRRRYKPAKGANPVVVIVGLVFAVTVGIGVWYALSVLRSPKAIPDAAWKSVEVPGVLRVKLPGSSSTETLNSAGARFVMQTCSPDEDSMYGVGYMPDPIPEQRRSLSAERLLNDACDGSKNSLAKQGGVEVSRESITLGPHPGKQLVVDVPQGNGKLVYRIYLANDRIVMLMAGGKGLDADHSNVKKLFASLEITTVSAPPPPDKEPKPKGKP